MRCGVVAAAASGGVGIPGNTEVSLSQQWVSLQGVVRWPPRMSVDRCPAVQGGLQAQLNSRREGEA